MAIVLLQTVGTGDGVSIPLAKVIAERSPQKVCFLVSKKSREKTLPLILKQVPPKQYRYDSQIVEIEDQDSFNACAGAVRETIAALIQQGFHPRKLYCDYTSGTKSMSSALVATAIERPGITLIYTSGERDREGKVISGTEEINYISPSQTLAHRSFHQATLAFNNYRYQEVMTHCQNAQEIYGEATFIEKCATLSSLAQGYLLWDRFELKQAYQQLSALERAEVEQLSICSQWGQNKKALKEEVDHPYTPYRLADLLENAKRRMQEQKYDDALARLYRLLEYISQFLLHQRGLISKESSAVCYEKLSDSLKTEFAKQAKRGSLEIGLHKKFYIASQMGIQKAKIFYHAITDRDGDLRKILHARNHSILAHGFHPVGEAKTKKALALTEEHLTLLLPNFQSLSAQVRFPRLKVE